MAETKRKEREIFPLTLGWEWGCVRVAATLPSIVRRPSVICQIAALATEITFYGVGGFD